VRGGSSHWLTYLVTRGLRCLGVESHSQSPSNLDDRCEARVSIGAKRAVEALAAKSGILGDLRHARVTRPFVDVQSVCCGLRARALHRRNAKSQIHTRRYLRLWEVLVETRERRAALGIVLQAQRRPLGAAGKTKERRFLARCSG
jgi:hypothetical protein